MKKWIKWVLALLVIVAALMILAPRTWVKNKHATILFDGKPVKGTLYHGTRGRQYVKTDLEKFIIESCGVSYTDFEKQFSGVRPIQFSKQDPLPGLTPQCVASAGSIGQPLCTTNSIDFTSCGGRQVRITWATPPR